MKIIASNFKTNHTRKSTNKFVNSLNSFLQNNNILNDVYIFPTSSSLDKFDTVDNLILGAQNGYYVKNGSYTGEIGTEQLDEFEIKTILIGHSERRHILGESQKEISLKYNYYKALGYKIIYCVGEPLEVKEQGISQTLEYLFGQFDGIDLEYNNIIIAYEPVWAIGTGLVPSSNEIELIHKKLKNKLQKPLLYGGSVKIDNISEILNIKNVDGALIGSGSWDIDNFKKIVEIASTK